MTSFLVTPIIVIMVTIIKLCTFLHASRATDATYRAPPLYHVCARVTYDVIAFPVADTTTAAGPIFYYLDVLAATSGASVTSQGHLRHRNSAAASRVVKGTTSLGLLSS